MEKWYSFKPDASELLHDRSLLTRVVHPLIH